jgi:hypothetical protein
MPVPFDFTKLKRSKAQSSSLDHSKTRSQPQLHEDLEQKQKEEAATKLKPAYRPRHRDDDGLARIFHPLVKLIYRTVF